MDANEIYRKYGLRRPSFLEGMARLCGLWGDLDASPEETLSEAEAIAADWRAAGDDMRKAIKEQA